MKSPGYGSRSTDERLFFTHVQQGGVRRVFLGFSIFDTTKQHNLSGPLLLVLGAVVIHGTQALARRNPIYSYFW